MEVDAPTWAMWHENLTMHVLFEVSRIMEGAHAHHIACSLQLKFQTSDSRHRDLSTVQSEKKSKKENIEWKSQRIEVSHFC